MVTPVLVNTGSANRDPAVFDDPERLDITREDPTAMLTFGGGVYYGLGAHLARIELTKALRVITQRMPNPRHAQPPPHQARALEGHDRNCRPDQRALAFDTGQ